MTTLTTNHLTLSRRAAARLWLARHDRLLFAAAVFTVATLIGLIIGVQLYRAISAPTAAPDPVIIIATARAERLPTPALATPAAQAAAAPSGHTLARVVVAYDAPNGRVIGAIDSGRRYVIAARFGTDWLQADVTGSGLVWLKMADLFDLPTDIADLQPSATPQIVTVPSAPQTVYVAAPAPAEQSYQVDSAQPQPQPTISTLGEPTAEAAYRQQIGLDMTDDELLADHQRQQAGSCDRGVITDVAYCAAVKQWLEEHK